MYRIKNITKSVYQKTFFVFCEKISLKPKFDWTLYFD